MAEKPLLNDKQMAVLLKAGPELDKLEPLMSPELRGVMVDLQRNTAEAYARGEWHVQSTGESFTVSDRPAMQAPHLPHAREALGNAYLQTSGAARDAFKTLMCELGIGRLAARVAPTNPPYFTL